MEKQSNIYDLLFKWGRKQDEYFKEGTRIEFAEQMLEAIDQAEAECAKANGNSQGARPASKGAWDTAKNLVTALAEEDITEKPRISASQNGILAFTFEGEKSSCTLYMETDNWIRYAMEANRKKQQGKGRIKNNTIPKRIIGWIKRTEHK